MTEDKLELPAKIVELVEQTLESCLIVCHILVSTDKVDDESKELIESLVRLVNRSADALSAKANPTIQPGAILYHGKMSNVSH